MRFVFGLVAASVVFVTPAFAETRALSGFESVSAAGRVEVEIAIGPQFSVELTGPRTDQVITRVIDGQLEIETRRNSGRWRGRDAHVRITMPALRALDVSAGAEVHARGVSAETFALDASSGAAAQIAGTCTIMTLDISSGANVAAGDFRCEDVRADASSGASAIVHAANAIAVDASSGASVRWEGEARARHIDLSSGGSARRLR